MQSHIPTAIEHVSRKSDGPPLDRGARITINFHPDIPVGREILIQVLARDPFYRSQFETNSSNGALSAFPGGERWEWESRNFGGAYDHADPILRPKYGALDFRRSTVGASPRFGSCHLRLSVALLERSTFCYPDSHLEPQNFGVASAMGLIPLALANAAGLEPLDDYIEAHVHGAVDLRSDVEAVVLDPSFRGTNVETAAATFPCPIEWHDGFRLPRQMIDVCTDYRGQEAVELLDSIMVDGSATAHDLGRARERAIDPVLLKKAWHCIARFGGPQHG